MGVAVRVRLNGGLVGIISNAHTVSRSDVSWLNDVGQGAPAATDSVAIAGSNALMSSSRRPGSAVSSTIAPSTVDGFRSTTHLATDGTAAPDQSAQ